jgi:uracil phosphoribosyltransferase
MSKSLPQNVHCSTHPCLQAKLSQLRGASTNARETKALVHEIALIIGCEALGAGLSTTEGSKVRNHYLSGVLMNADGCDRARHL